MRVGVLSDSHGDVEQAVRAVEEMGKIDLLVHAGDYYRDALCLADRFGLEVKAVVGNCDRGEKGPVEELFELVGRKVYLTHGHIYGVKQGLLRLHYRAREVGADIVIFGHTHIPGKEDVDGILFLNPGSVVWSRLGGKGSYAVLQVDETGCDAAIFELP